MRGTLIFGVDFVMLNNQKISICHYKGCELAMSLLPISNTVSQAWIPREQSCLTMIVEVSASKRSLGNQTHENERSSYDVKLNKLSYVISY